jgi:hypothetical protein
MTGTTVFSGYRIELAIECIQILVQITYNNLGWRKPLSADLHRPQAATEKEKWEATSDVISTTHGNSFFEFSSTRRKNTLE